MADVTDAAWDGSASRFTDAQYAHSAILDRGPSITSAKERYSLPVREPDGTLNKRALAAAAAALSGGRGGVNATDEQKAAARSKLRSLYSQAGMTTAKSEDGQTELTVPLIADQAQHLVYGVVLTPDQVDSQGDTVTAQEIEKAAHRWLVEYRKHDVQHDGKPAAMEPVESFIAPADLQIAGQPVLKGAWVLGVHVNDAATWDRVQKGELTGFSIGGTAERV